MKKTFTAALSAALIAGSAQQAMAEPVAILQDVSHQVAVQNEKGISRAVPGTALAYGDRIATGPEGNAAVSFPAGKCLGNRQVPPGTLATVSEKSCLDFVTGAKAEAEWVTMAMLAGLAIGGGVLAFELLQNNNNDKRPLSP